MPLISYVNRAKKLRFFFWQHICVANCSTVNSFLCLKHKERSKMKRKWYYINKQFYFQSGRSKAWPSNQLLNAFKNDAMEKMWQWGRSDSQRILNGLQSKPINLHQFRNSDWHLIQGHIFPSELKCVFLCMWIVHFLPTRDYANCKLISKWNSIIELPNWLISTN